MIDYCFCYHKDNASGKFLVEKRYPWKDVKSGVKTWYLDSMFDTLEAAQKWCVRRNLNVLPF